MVSQQATQDGNTSRPTDWPHPRGEGDSVRITAKDVPADVRRQILREHYEERLSRQQAVVKLEAGIRNSNATGALLYSQADLRVSNMAAVQQDIASMVAAYTDNRDFKGQVA